jgi:hypothetical protein
MSPTHKRSHIRLPPMTGEQALLMTDLLDCILTALWHAHGDDMADLVVARGEITAPATAATTDDDDLLF